MRNAIIALAIWQVIVVAPSGGGGYFITDANGNTTIVMPLTGSAAPKIIEVPEKKE